MHDETLNAIIQRAVRDMVDRCGGNKSDAARRLGISRTRLLRLLGKQPESVHRPTPADASDAQLQRAMLRVVDSR